MTIKNQRYLLNQLSFEELYAMIDDMYVDRAFWENTAKHIFIKADKKKLIDWLINVRISVLN